VFLINGMPNNIFRRWSSAPFDQDSIFEFQVSSAGYKQSLPWLWESSMLTKSGTVSARLLSLFHRNRVLDSSNVQGKSTPFLLRWDPSGIWEDHFSARSLRFGSYNGLGNPAPQFNFQPAFQISCVCVRNSFDRNSQLSQTRGFVRFDEQVGRHH